MTSRDISNAPLLPTLDAPLQGDHEVPEHPKQLAHIAIPNMQHSVIAALQSIKNPRVACHRLHILIKLLTDQLRTMSEVKLPTL